MNTLRKTTIATLAGLGALAVAASAPALSHGPGQGGPGYGPGYGMMGGMMGPGAGYGGQQGFGPAAGYGGMMGPGHGHGFGNGAGFGPCGQAAAAGEDIDVDGVKARMERWLTVQNNERLKLGKVEEVDDDTITAEILTVDGSLVHKVAVDRHTGRMQPAK
jgi:hypothetical protein